jgi:hypothetical protein
MYYGNADSITDDVICDRCIMAMTILLLMMATTEIKINSVDCSVAFLATVSTSVSFKRSFLVMMLFEATIMIVAMIS